MTRFFSCLNVQGHKNDELQLPWPTSKRASIYNIKSLQIISYSAGLALRIIREQSVPCSNGTCTVKYSYIIFDIAYTYFSLTATLPKFIWLDFLNQNKKCWYTTKKQPKQVSILQKEREHDSESSRHLSLCNKHSITDTIS